ncbi:MAG: hypothetical protein K0S11_306 [Gammaproteobacteria bacterium]|jgi:hypothetical protein|nr:hypothetical protein [Gammaproteobacteria bacterium]
MNLKNTTVSNGSSQNDRLSQKLAANYIAVEERSIEQLLEFVQAYAAKLTYYNNDNLANGTWAGFFNQQDFNIQELVAYLKNPADFQQYPQKLARYSQPHIGLLLAFLQLLQHPQQQFQDLTQRHLDFYYQNVLSLQPKSPTADQVNVIFTLEDNIDFYQINKGTLLTAGQDSLGNDLFYSLDNDFLASQAQLARVNTLAVKKFTAEGGAHKITGIVPLTVYDTDAKVLFSSSGFDTFGDVSVDTEKDELTQTWPQYPIHMGLVLSSPILLLESGERNITLTLSCLYANLDETVVTTASPFSPHFLGKFTEFFTIEMSGGDKWLTPIISATNAVQLTTDDNGYIRGTLEFKLTLPNTEVAVVAPSAELSPELNVAYPAIRFLLKPLVRNDEGDTNYQLLKNLWLENLDITVEVQALKNLELRSDNNVLDGQSPFQPFGSSPIAGNSFYFANEELCSKKLDELSVTIEWMDLPNDFKTYYQAYSDTAVFQEKYKDYPDLIAKGINNDSFSASLKLYDNHRWYEMGEAQKLFEGTAANPDRLSNIRNQTYAAIDEESYIARPIDISDDELLNWSRYFKLELNNPDFMHSLYALVVSENANSMMYYQQVNQLKIELQPYLNIIAAQTQIINQANADKQAVIDTQNQLADYNGKRNALLNASGGGSLAQLQQDTMAYKNYPSQLSELEARIAQKNAELNVYWVYYYYFNDPRWQGYVWWYPTIYLNRYYQLRDELNQLIADRTALIASLPELARKYEAAQGPLAQKEKELSDYGAIIGIDANGNDLQPLQGLKLKLKTVTDKASDAQKRINDATSVLEKAKTDGKPYQDKYDAAVAIARSHLPDNVAGREYTSPATVYPAYIPKIKNFSLGYKTHASINLQAIAQQNEQQIIQVNPSGVTDIANVTVLDPNAAVATKLYPLLPRYTEEAALFLGFSNLLPPQNLALLFQMVPSSGSSMVAKPDIKWSYLVNDSWQALDKSNLLLDTTNGLLDSGILRFAIPADATPSTELFTGGFYWLKATINENSVAIGKTLDIRTQAVSATFVDQENAPDHLSKPLAANTITDLVNSDPLVKSVSQPYPSTKGRMAEDNANFAIRVSERLRHKQRGLTGWDYERLVLEHFPEIYKVKCITQTGQSGAYDPAKVVLIVIPNVVNTDPTFALQPKAPLYLLEDIKTYLANFLSPFVKLEVKNPIYQQLSYRVGVKFYKEYEQGSYVKQLNDELVQFLTPWAYGQQVDIDFGSVLHSSSVIHFIEQRPYVDYVSSLSLTQYIPSSDGSGQLQPINSSTGLAQTLSPEAILVSAPTHTIDMLSGTKKEYTAATTGIGYFKIGDSFYIAPTM